MKTRLTIAAPFLLALSLSPALHAATKSSKSEPFCLNGKSIKVHHPEGMKVDWAKGVDVYPGKCQDEAVWYEPAIKQHETELLTQKKGKTHEAKD